MSASKSLDAVQVEVHNVTPGEVLKQEPLVQTVMKGEIPSNDQMNDAIDRAVESIEETKEKAHLNDKGERLVADMEHLLQTSQRLINERNSGDNIQHLIGDTKEMGLDVTGGIAKQGGKLLSDIRHSIPHIPTRTELIFKAIPTVATHLPGVLASLPDMTQLSLDDVKTLFDSISSNVTFNFPSDEIKELCGDAVDAYNLGKEIMLYSVHSKEFRTLLGEVTEFFQTSFGEISEKASEVGDAVKMDIDNKNTAASNTRETLKKDGKELVQAAKDSHPLEMTDEMRKEAYEKFSKLANKIASKPEYKQLLNLYWKYMDEVKEKADKIADKLKEKAEDFKEKASEAADRLKEKADDIKDAAKEKAVQLKDAAKDKANELKEDVKESASEFRDESAPAFDKVWGDVRDLVDSFGGRGTFDSFYMDTYKFYARLFHDKAARAYLHDLRSFTASAVEDPKALTSSSTAQSGMDLITRGRKLVQSDRYSRQFSKFFSQWNALINNFANDSLVNEFSQELHQFVRDFALDSKGRPDIYAITESLGQIKSFIYPILVRQLENMTVAKIVGNSEAYDWTIEDLSVGIANFVPESFDLRTKNHTKMNVKDLEAKESNTRIILDIQSLKPHFNDVKFWYRRRSFPHIEDKGVADVDLTGGEGTRIKIIWKIKSKHNRPFAFSLMEVKCTIDKMDIKVKNAQHDILDKIAASLFVGNIKQQVANGIVNAIVDVLHPINDAMNKWFASRPINSVYDKINDRIHEEFAKGAKETNKFIQGHPVDSIIHKARESLEKAKEGVSDTADMVVDGASNLRDGASILKRKASKTLSEESGSDFKDRAAQLKDAALDKASALKHSVQEMDISGYIPTDMEDAKAKAGQLKDKIVEKGSELKDAAEQRFPNATHRAEELANAAIEKGTQIKDQVMEQAPELADKASKKAVELKDAAVEKGTQIKDQVMEQAPELADKASKKASELKDAAVEKGTQIKDQVMEQAPELADKASKKANELKDQAVEKVGELSESAKQKASELAEKYPEAAKKANDLKDMAVEKGTELKDKAVELKDKAMDKGSDLKDAAQSYTPSSLPDAAEKASQLKDKAVEKGTELKDKAVEKGTELKDKAVEKGTELKDKAVEKATEVKDKAVEKGSEAMDKATEVKDKAVAKGSEAKDKAVEKASELTDSAVQSNVSFLDAAKGNVSEKKNKEGKWDHHWKKPKKTAKPVTVEKLTITQTREVIMEDKIASNPYEALSDENLGKKNAS